MTRADDASGAAGRRAVAALLLAYLLFFVYGSLVPLQLRQQGLDSAWQFFMALPGPSWRESERVDFAVNFLLTVPLAFGLAHLATTAASQTGRLLGWLAIAPALALLSLGVEFAQVFFPPRDPSWTDFVAQLAGTLAGMSLYAVLGWAFRRLLAQLVQRESRELRVQAWLIGYLLLMLAFGLMPLDLSISPVELYRKWRDGRVVLIPFGGPWHGTWMFVYELLSDIALWVPVGLLWRLQGSRGTRAVVLRTVGAAAAIECAQLLVLSRVSDVTDVLLAAVGGAAGAGLHRALAAWLALQPWRRDAWLVRLWWLWLAGAMAVLWLPFDFRWPDDVAAAGLQAFTRLPFQTYFERGEFHALNEILRKMLVFLPGGLLLGARATLTLPRRLPGVGTMLALALVLEAGQLFLPDKVADLTDALLGALGAWVGSGIARSLDLGPLPAGGHVPALAAAAGPAAQPARPWVPPLALQALPAAAVALLVWLAARTPGVPYNLAKLVPAGAGGLLSAAGLALAAWWIVAAPLALLAPQRSAMRVLAPLLVLLHGLASFAVLRATVPLHMLYKVIGDPVLDWPGPLEDVGRYLALHACIVMPLLGAALLVQAARCGAWRDFVYWVMTMLWMFWPLHWVVVERAGTDNLVELMRGGGGVGASLALGSAWLATATAGSALAAAAAPRRRGPLLVLVVLALALAPALFAAGLEPMLVKYDRVFSALQFIVSAGRDRYASGDELAFRAAAALVSIVLAVSLLQLLPWLARAAADRPRPPRA